MKIYNDDKSWKVFDYEVKMFKSIIKYKSSISLIDRDINKIVHYAISESLILHLRVLADIILSRGKWPDDINLNKILPNFHSSNIDQLNSLYGLHTEKNTPCWRFNKLLAHATTERSECHDYTDAVNLLAPIIENIISEINEFRKNVNPT